MLRWRTASGYWEGQYLGARVWRGQLGWRNTPNQSKKWKPRVPYGCWTQCPLTVNCPHPWKSDQWLWTLEALGFQKVTLFLGESQGSLNLYLQPPDLQTPAYNIQLEGVKLCIIKPSKFPPESDKKQEWERQNLLTLWPQEKLIFQSRRRKLWKDL